MSWSHRVYRPDGSWWLHLVADDDARVVRRFAEDGTLLASDPYGPIEVADLEARLVADAQATSRATVLGRARSALAGNAAYLALPSRTSAQVAAQVADLTRQSSALIRLALRDFDSAD